jgi:hypothetical protein
VTQESTASEFSPVSLEACPQAASDNRDQNRVSAILEAMRALMRTLRERVSKPSELPTIWLVGHVSASGKVLQLIRDDSVCAASPCHSPATFWWSLPRSGFVTPSISVVVCCCLAVTSSVLICRLRPAPRTVHQPDCFYGHAREPSVTSVSQMTAGVCYGVTNENGSRSKCFGMAERLDVTPIADVATKRTVRSMELDQWLGGGVRKLRPGGDYYVDPEVMQRRL